MPRRPQHATPQPFSTFVVKVASRCNINCKYCYMYEHADQSWRSQPPFLEPPLVSQLATRLKEYGDLDAPRQMLVIAHGGEPLLYGSSRLDRFFGTIAERMSGSNASLRFGIQTNATLVTPDLVSVLQRYDVRAGVSLDGPPAHFDQRLDNLGRPTMDAVLAGVHQLRNPSTGPSTFGGFLAVADPRHDPNDFLAFFETLGAPVDVLLPEYNYDTIPSHLRSPILGRWLIRLFDRWFPTDSSVSIRLFETIMRLTLGARLGYDALGANSRSVLGIETDGSYHGVDILKTTFHGATTLGKHLTLHPIAPLESEPIVMALATKAFAAADSCLDCSLFAVCGGGYLPQRYSSINGFDNVSVYCEDYKLLLPHIAARIAAELSSP